MNWTIFDYGVGNLHSIRKAIGLFAPVQVTQEPEALADADGIVLPGVGAFAPVMERLAPAADQIRAHHSAGKPLLGICIGMQALYEGSQEAPGVAGLGIIPGMVQALPASAGKIPHMGWNDVAWAPGAALSQHVPNEQVYYVHSYAAPVGPHTIATSDYGGPFTAAVQDGATLGFQFHPEKSSSTGRSILNAALQSEHA